MQTKGGTVNRLSLKIVEAQISQNSLPAALCKHSYQAYVSLVYNNQIFKTASAQGNVQN
jgi:hypothetical protein